MGTLLLLVSAVIISYLPPIIEPEDNITTFEKISLGKQLFFDKRLSANNTVSCSTCHDPMRGWTDNRRVPIGILNRRGTRNAPTIINSGQQSLQFWDGRARLLEGQAILPLTNIREMGNNSFESLEKKLNATGYRQRFNEVFGTDVTTVGIGKAISSFERSVITDDAPIDRYLAGETWALTQRAKDGFDTFKRVNCIECHKPNNNFRDDRFHNTGIASRFGEDEQGRFTISGQANQFRAFKTPTLREITRTAPYTHAGRITTIRGMIEHYNNGGSNDQNQDARIRPLGLSEREKDNLEIFLKEGLASSVSSEITEPYLPD